MRLVQAVRFAARVGAALAWVMVTAGCAGGPRARAERALDEGDLSAAAAAFGEAARASPGDVTLWMRLADVELRRGRAASAREALRRARQLAPDDPRPLLAMGESYELDRDYARAEAAYREAVALQPQRPGPVRWLGARLLRWGKSEQAAVVLERAIELDGSHAETFNALGLARHHAGDVAGAERAFRAGARRHPEHLRLKLGLAAVLINRGAREEALGVYEAAAQQHPDFAPLHVGRALLLDSLERREEALAAFQRAVDVAEDPRPYRVRLERYRSSLAARGATQSPAR